MTDRPKDTRTPEERRADAIRVLVAKQAEAIQLRSIASRSETDEILVYSGSASAVAIGQDGKPVGVSIVEAPSLKAIIQDVGIEAVRRLNLTGDVVEALDRREAARRAVDSLDALIGDLEADLADQDAPTAL